MATVIIMPRNGQSVESCIITAWNKQVGDEVKQGDLLFSYETDKSAFDEESPVDGTLLAILHDVDDDVPCLENVCVIGTPGEDISMYTAGSAPAPAAEPAPSAEPVKDKDTPVPAAPAASSAERGNAAGVSPRARAAAERLHVDISAVTPTGPNGRIIERDILAAQKSTAGALAQGSTAAFTGTGIGGRVSTTDMENAPATAPAAPAPAPAAAPAAAPSEPGFRDEALPRLRKMIGNTMLQSLQGSAQLTHMLSVDADDMIAFRSRIKAAPESLGLPKITFNDILLYAVSRVILHYPELNANLIDDSTMRYYDHAHIGMAVDTPRGLLVPVIRNADQKSLAEISAEAKSLAAAAREGSIDPDLLNGGSFTVSNLGSFGIEYYTPVINPPQTGILGVGTLTDRIRVVDGQVVPYKAMGLSLTYDHRALDGAPASRFLKELKETLENFTALLIL